MKNNSRIYDSYILISGVRNLDCDLQNGPGSHLAVRSELRNKIGLTLLLVNDKPESSRTLPATIAQLAAPPLPTLPVDHPLTIMGEYTAQLNGLGPEPSLLPSLAAVAAAAGPLAKMKTPDGRWVTGVFHGILAGSTCHLGEVQCIPSCFSALQNRVNLDLVHMPKSSKVRDAMGIAAASELKRTKERLRSSFHSLKELIPQEEERERFVKMASQCGAENYRSFAGINTAQDFIQARKDYDTSEEHASIVVRTQGPMFIAESLSPEALIHYDRLGPQGALYLKDDFGISLQGFLVASERTRSRIFDLMRASFDGVPAVSGKRPLPAPFLGMIGRLSPSIVKMLLEDPPARHGGLLHRLVFFDLSGAPQKLMECEIGLEPCSPYEKMLFSLYAARTKCRERNLRLAPEATKSYSHFVNDLSSLSAAIPNFQAFIEQWPILALKFAMLLHLGSGSSEDEIPHPTLNSACELTRAMGGRSLALLYKLGYGLSEHNRRLEADVELIVDRVRARGSMSLRQLQRTFHSRTVASLEPAIALAIEQKRIERDDCGNLISPRTSPFQSESRTRSELPEPGSAAE